MRERGEGCLSVNEQLRNPILGRNLPLGLRTEVDSKGVDLGRGDCEAGGRLMAAMRDQMAAAFDKRLVQIESAHAST